MSERVITETIIVEWVPISWLDPELCRCGHLHTPRVPRIPETASVSHVRRFLGGNAGASNWAPQWGVCDHEGCSCDTLRKA